MLLFVVDVFMNVCCDIEIVVLCENNLCVIMCELCVVNDCFEVGEIICIDVVIVEVCLVGVCVELVVVCGNLMML